MPLEEQDRSLWDRELIAEAAEAYRRALCLELTAPERAHLQRRLSALEKK